MKKKCLYPLALLMLLLMFAACVKDTDFDQADQVTLTPVVELNLIFFNLQGSDFYDEVNNTPRLTLRDTTEIRFLDDSDVQESLLRAEFLFRFNNSIPRDFLVDFQFISEMNDTTYVTQTDVAQGSVESPVLTEFEHVVEGDAILDLTMANRVVVSVTIPSAEPNLEGTLNLQSKTTYFLEIRDRE